MFCCKLQALIEFDVIMMEDEAPRYISKGWGLLDYRRFKVLYKQICDENPHMPCDSEEVEIDFNNLVDRLVFGEVQALGGANSCIIIEKGNGIGRQFRIVIQIVTLKECNLLVRNVHSLQVIITKSLIKIIRIFLES